MDVTQVTDVEKRLLSALMLDDGEAMAEVVEVLKAEDFCRPEHRAIYSAILRLYAADAALDIRAVCNELEKSGDLKRVTQKHLTGLMTIEYTKSRALQYAKEIKEAALKRRLAEIGRELTDEAIRGKRTSAEILSYAESNLTAITLPTTGMESAREIALQTYSEISKMTGEIIGLRTGLYDLDKMTSGLKKSDMIILAARPSMGKTALAMNIAAHVAGLNTVAVFSLEMSKRQLMQRMLSAEAQVNASRLQRGDLNELERRKVFSAAGIIGEKKLYIDDTGGLSLMSLKTKARRLKREQGLDLIVIDYLQLMQASKEYRGNRVQEVSELSRGLKALAKELDVPVLVLSQLSRAVEQRAEKKPQLSDLRESGSIEQDADIVIFLYREDYYNHDESENIAEAIVAKNRNGMTGSVRLYFDKTTVTFRNLTRRAD